jgi:hypothetical protein
MEFITYHDYSIWKWNSNFHNLKKAWYLWYKEVQFYVMLGNYFKFILYLIISKEDCRLKWASRSGVPQDTEKGIILGFSFQRCHAFIV